jgi:hypothetical protein
MVEELIIVDAMIDELMRMQQVKCWLKGLTKLTLMPSEPMRIMHYLCVFFSMHLLC